MGTKSGVGVSNHRNPILAGKEAAQHAMETMGSDFPDFVFVFATVGYNQNVLIQSIYKECKNAPLSGCSGEGVIGMDNADESNFFVAVMAICSDDILFSNFVESGISQSSYDVGKSLAETMKANWVDKVKGAFIFADALAFNFDKFILGFETSMDQTPPIPLFGGLAADNWEMKKVYQYHNDQVYSDSVSAVLISGNVSICWEVNHGCVPIGNRRKVTRSKNNTIYEIDNKPVLDVLKEYLDGDAIDNWMDTIVSLCWGFEAPDNLVEEYQNKYLIRFMPSKDDELKGVNIPTEVHNGMNIWMTRRDHALVTKGVNLLGQQLKKKLGKNTPKMVFHFDCGGRGKMLFREQKINILLNQLRSCVGEQSPWIGFYTYGEIAPLVTTNCFHNYTAAIVVLY
ncbi:MAG: histidine kinase [Desulfobacteraceae bacterium]|nr:histidine kinase [Desulfobacteraceae bacterium]